MRVAMYLLAGVRINLLFIYPLLLPVTDQTAVYFVMAVAFVIINTLGLMIAIIPIYRRWRGL